MDCMVDWDLTLLQEVKIDRPAKEGWLEKQSES